jgi:hypothetical protein
MRELIQHVGTYAGELIITGIALLIRSVEKRLIIRRNRKKWEAGETYSKIKNDYGIGKEYN